MFLNRSDERKRASDFFGPASPAKSKVLFVTGHTGVGKSGLVQYLSENEFTALGLSVISVHVSKSSPDTIENNHYFNALYSAVAAFGKEKIFDKFPSPAQYGGRNVKNWVRMAKDTAFNKVGIPEGARFYEPIQPLDVIRKRDYIVAAIKRKKVIIDIENIQNVDTVSFELLIDLLRRLDGAAMILEYTLEEGNLDKLLNMMNEMSGIAQCQILAIDKLDFSEAKALIPVGQFVDMTALKRSYEDGRGNLMLVILAHKGINQSNDSIELSFESLTKNEKYLIYLLYWNDGFMPLNMMREILFSQAFQQYQVFTQPVLYKSLENLIDAAFTKVENQGIAIRHDSIIDEIEKHTINPVMLTAYRLLKEYYVRQVANSTEAPDEYVEKLFILYLKSGDEDMARIVGHMKKLVLKCKYPKIMLSKIDYYQSKILSDTSKNINAIDKVFEAFSELSYYLSDYSEANRTIPYFYQDSIPRHRALKAGLLAVDHSDDAQSKLCALMAREDSGSRLLLTIELLVLVDKMRTSPKAESVNCAYEMLRRYKGCQYLEYGYLLRCCAELSDDFQHIYDTFDFCLKHFAQHERADLQAEIHLSISMIDAYLGKLNQAMDHIGISESLAPGHIKQNYVLNNTAVIEMLHGHFTFEVGDSLNDALLLDGDDYTKIITKSNLLVFYCKTGQMEAAHEVASSIEASGYAEFGYDELQMIVFLNLAYYYGQLGNEHETYYMDRLYKVSGGKAANLYMPSKFYEGFPYRLDFLGYWRFEISQDL